MIVNMRDRRELPSKLEGPKLGDVMNVIEFPKINKGKRVGKLRETEELFRSIGVNITGDIGSIFSVIQSQAMEVHSLLSNVNINNEECVNECNKKAIDIIHTIASMLYKVGGICQDINKRVENFIYKD